MKRGTKRARRNPAATTESRSINRLIRKYTELHEGRKPDAILKETLPNRLPKYYIELGPMPEAMYLKKTAESENEMFPYRHPFANWAMPTLVHDDQGKLHIVDQQNLTVTTRGIEDHMAKRSHKSIARLNPHAGARMLGARHNPFGMQAFKKVAISAGAVGVGAALTGIGLGMGLDYLSTKWKKADGTPMLAGYGAAGAAAAVGVVAAVGIQSMSHGNDIAEVAAAAVGIGGVVAGTHMAYDKYRTDHPSTPAASTPAATTPSAPSQGAFHPPVAAPQWRSVA